MVSPASVAGRSNESYIGKNPKRIGPRPTCGLRFSVNEHRGIGRTLRTELPPCGLRKPGLAVRELRTHANGQSDGLEKFTDIERTIKGSRRDDDQRFRIAHASSSGVFLEGHPSSETNAGSVTARSR